MKYTEYQTCRTFGRFFYFHYFPKNEDKKKAASTSCLKAMKTIKQCSENRKLETIK